MAPPNLFDLQVNGYGGVDFNADTLDGDALRSACEHMAQDGVRAFLLTLITDDIERTAAKLTNIVSLHNQDSLIQTMVHGIHLEGPFISPAPGYVGAHRSEAVRPGCLEDAKRLVDAGQGLIRLVTLAPEQDAEARLTQWLVKQGVVVSAGHTNATRNELWAALDQGLSMFTHFGNGCPALLPRHDNILARVLSLFDRLWFCFIADGVHIPYFVLANYMRFVGLQRAIVVSDAISAAGMGPGEYTLGEQRVRVDDSLATWSADGSHLMGSACPLRQGAANLREHLGFSAADVEQVTLLNPGLAMASNDC